MARADEQRLTGEIIELAFQYVRYGHHIATGLLNNEGWHVNHKRGERVSLREGLTVQKRSPKRRTCRYRSGRSETDCMKDV